MDKIGGHRGPTREKKGRIQKVRENYEETNGITKEKEEKKNEKNCKILKNLGT